MQREVGACVMAIALAGCLVPKEAMDASPWFSVTLAPQLLDQANETLVVQVTLHVPSDHAYVSPDGCGGAHDYVVTAVDASGKIRVPLYWYGTSWWRACTGAETPVTMAAGKYMQAFQWNGLREADQSIPAQAHRGERVEPGAYTVVVQHSDLGFLRAEATVVVMPVQTEA